MRTARKVTICPTCKHRCVEYTHPIAAHMAYSLATVYRKYGTRPGHVNEELTGLKHNKLGNFQKLRYFGLVEPYITRGTARKRGWWRVTEFGEQWLRGQVKCRQYARTSNAEVIGYEGGTVGFGDVLPDYTYRAQWAEQGRARTDSQSDMFPEGGGKV